MIIKIKFHILIFILSQKVAVVTFCISIGTRIFDADLLIFTIFAFCLLFIFGLFFLICPYYLFWMINVVGVAPVVILGDISFWSCILFTIINNELEILTDFYANLDFETIYSRIKDTRNFNFPRIWRGKFSENLDLSIGVHKSVIVIKWLEI